MYIQKKNNADLFVALLVSMVLGLTVSLIYLVMADAQRAAEIYYQQLMSEADLPQDIKQLELTPEQIMEAAQKSKEAQRKAWYAAIGKLIAVDDSITDRERSREKFMACFLEDDACAVYSQAYRNGFNQQTFYFAPSSYVAEDNHVSFYISLKDHETPQILMRFAYVDDLWLYMKKVSIVTDDELILDEELPVIRTRRKMLEDGRVYEYGDLALTDRLRVVDKIAESINISIAMKGVEKTEYMSEQALENIALQAHQILKMYFLLKNAIDEATAQEDIELVNNEMSERTESEPDAEVEQLGQNEVTKTEETPSE